MIFQADGIQRRAGVVVLISDEIDFKIKNETKGQGNSGSTELPESKR